MAHSTLSKRGWQSILVSYTMFKCGFYSQKIHSFFLEISVTHWILVTWWLITGVTICHSVWDKMGHNWESKQYLPIIIIASCTILSQLCCTHNISFRCAFPTANVCIILLFSVDRRLFRWSMVVLIWLAGGYLIIF